MPALDPHDHTNETAQQEFYPDLRPEDIDLFYLSFLRQGESEVETVYLWLPIAEADEMMDEEVRLNNATIIDWGLEREND